MSGNSPELSAFLASLLVAPQHVCGPECKCAELRKVGEIGECGGISVETTENVGEGIVRPTAELKLRERLNGLAERTDLAGSFVWDRNFGK